LIPIEFIFGNSLPAYLVNLGNLVFFLANFPQVITAFKNRKNLAGLSFNYLLWLFIGTILFAIGNYYIGAYIASVLCITSLFFYGAQMFWKKKYKLQKKLSLDEAGWHEVES
jgi:uncharacterized protein with PQ loop repeat